MTPLVPSVSPDPWGNAYLVNDTWIISAGPNGVIETPFHQPAAPASPLGDDRALPLR